MIKGLWQKRRWGRQTEPVFVNLLRSPEIDSQPGDPIRQHYLTYLPARQHRLAESIPWNRFLGFLNASDLHIPFMPEGSYNIVLLHSLYGSSLTISHSTGQNPLPVHSLAFSYFSLVLSN